MCGRRDGLYHAATAHCCCSAMTNSEEKAKAKTCSVSVPAASGAQGHVTPPPHTADVSRCAIWFTYLPRVHLHWRCRMFGSCSLLFLLPSGGINAPSPPSSQRNKTSFQSLRFVIIFLFELRYCQEDSGLEDGKKKKLLCLWAAINLPPLAPTPPPPPPQ